MLAVAIALEGGDVGLVEGGEMTDAVAEPARDDERVIGEPAGAIAVLPAAAIFERLRQIPVIEADPRLDAGGEHAIDKTLVEFQPLGVHRAAAFRQDARPTRRQP